MNAMKRKIAIIVVVLCLAVSLMACGSKLSGTYASTGLISQIFTFEGSNVTINGAEAC